MKQSFAAITTALTLLTSFNLFASVSGVATNYTFTFDNPIVSTTLQKELYGIAQASPYSSLLTIGNVSAPEGTVATVIIDEPMSGAFATILATAKDSLGPFQLCHLTKVECTDGTTKTETPFTDLACTSAVVLYSLELKLSAIPQGFDITAISNYIAQSAATVQALSGYKTAFISQAPENTPAAADAAGVVYSFYVEEQQPGLFGNITCSVLPPGGYACLIDAISNNVTGTCCSDLALCVPANTTYTLKFGKAVTQAAIMSELAALVTTMNAAQSAYTYSISSLSLGSDALSVQLNVSESEANTFGGLFCQSASQIPLYSMLCHFESVSFGDGTPVCSGISLQCTEPVETEYTIKFVADVSSVITVAEIEEYLTTIIVGAKLTTGYDVDYISGSGKLSGDKFTGKFKEPVAGAVGEFACASFAGQTFPPGDYACFISGIYTSEGVGCKNLTLCHSSGPQNTTYTMKFNQAVTQTALGSELTTLITTMNAAQSFYTYSLVGVSVDQEDKRTVALTVSESEANTFGGLFCRSAPQIPLYSMLCHFESVALSDGTSVCSGISLPCSDYVETQYEIRFDDNLPDLFTKELFDLYANGLATSAAAVSGYNITVVPDSGSFSENIYSMTLREPIHGSIAEFMCGFYQSGTYYPGHYACHIRAVYADKKAYCKKMELCPASFTSNSDKKDEGGNSNTNASSTQAPFASFVLTMLSFALLITLF